MVNPTMSFSAAEIFANSTAEDLGLKEIVQICVLSINVLFVVLTNIYMIWLITRTRSGVASEFTNLNLSVCEIGVSLNFFVFIVYVTCILSYGFHIIIIVFQSLQGLALTGRPLFQSLICVERYLAVVHPVTFLKYKPLRYRVMCCAVAWIIILGGCFHCISLFASGEFAFVNFCTIQFVVLLSIQLFCLVAVLRALKQSGPGERMREKEENHMKRRAFYLILITTVSMVIAYILYFSATLTTIEKMAFVPTHTLSTLICYMLASFVHPVLYLHRTLKLSRLCLS